MIDELLLSTDEKIKALKNLPIEYHNMINPPPKQEPVLECLELRQSRYRRTTNNQTRLPLHFCGSAEPTSMQPKKTSRKTSKYRQLLLEVNEKAAPPAGPSNKYVRLVDGLV